MKNEKNLRRWLFWFSFALASIMVYKFLDNFKSITNFIGNFLSIIKPFLHAILIAYLLYLPCKKIEETFYNSGVDYLKEHRRGYSVFTVYLIAITLIFIIVNFIWPTLVSSLMDLISNLPGYYRSAISFFEDAPFGSWQNRLYQTKAMQDLASYDFAANLNELFSGGQVGEYFKMIMGTANTVFDLFVTFIVSIYILAERSDIRSFCRNVCKAVLNDDQYKKARKYYNNSNSIFAHFITGQLLDAVIVGTAMAVVLSLMHVRYAIILGYMIGFFNLIPYFGAIFGSIFAGLITIFTGGIEQALWLGIWALIVQQIDGNIINPRILGNQLKISPILVIFAVTVGGAYFGIIGMFLGVPTMALIKIIVNDVIEEKIYEKEHMAIDENGMVKAVKPKAIKVNETPKNPKVIKVEKAAKNVKEKKSTTKNSKTGK